MHWVGKRKVALAAIAGNAACCLTIAIYSYVVLRPDVTSEYAKPWIPATMVVALAFFTGLYSSVPWAWLREIFPVRWVDGKNLSFLHTLLSQI
jgi:MFS family permease